MYLNYKYLAAPPYDPPLYLKVTDLSSSCHSKNRFSEYVIMSFIVIRHSIAYAVDFYNVQRIHYAAYLVSVTFVRRAISVSFKADYFGIHHCSPTTIFGVLDSVVSNTLSVSLTDVSS